MVQLTHKTQLNSFVLDKKFFGRVGSTTEVDLLIIYISILVLLKLFYQGMDVGFPSVLK